MGRRSTPRLRFRVEMVTVDPMELVVPDDLTLESGCSPPELLFGLAVGLVLDGRLTLGRAAGLAGLSKIAFLEELGRRRIPMPYDERDRKADLLASLFLMEQRGSYCWSARARADLLRLAET